MSYENGRYEKTGSSRMNYENEYRLIYTAVEDIKHSEAWDDFELLRERVDLIISTFGPDGSRAKQAKLKEPTFSPSMVTYQKKFQTIVQLDKVVDGLFAAHAGYPFRPMGLVLWGTDHTTLIHELHVGTTPQLLCRRPVLAQKFECARTLDELKEFAKQRLLAWPGEEYTLVECDVAQPGLILSLRIEGPLRDAALWGYGIK